MFIIITYMWTWIFWLPFIPSIQTVIHYSFNDKLIWLGMLGPLIAALVCSKVQSGNMTQLFKALTIWRVPVRYYCYIYLGTFVVFALGAYFTHRLTGITWLNHAMTSIKTPLLHAPWWCLPIEATTIALFCEEIGWRGYLLPLLAQKMNAFQASLVLGVVWAIWHFPLLLINGIMGIDLLKSMGLLTIHVIFYSVILSWFYFKSGRSTFITGLLHGWSNVLIFVFPIVLSPYGQGLNWVMLLLEVMILLLIVPSLRDYSQLEHDLSKASLND